MKTLFAVVAIFAGLNAFAADELPEECRAALVEQKAYFETMSAKVKADFERGVINEGERAVTEQLINAGKETVASGCMKAIYDAANSSSLLRSYYSLNTQTLERRASEARDQALTYLNGGGN